MFAVTPGRGQRDKVGVWEEESFFDFSLSSYLSLYAMWDKLIVTFLVLSLTERVVSVLAACLLRMAVLPLIST